MSKYDSIKLAHQYYRDVFTKEFILGDVGDLPREIIFDVLIKREINTYELNKKLLKVDTHLPPDDEKKLFLMLNAIAMSNLALNDKWGGKNVRLPDEYINMIIGCIDDIIHLGMNVEYLVVSIQLLFRIGAIEHAVNLIENNFSILDEIPSIYNLLLTICIFEKDYAAAIPLVQKITKQPELLGQDILIMMMILTTIFKNGGYPDSYIDFTSILNKKTLLPLNYYSWVLDARESNNKPTIVIACDNRYYFEHAISLLYSIYENNKHEFNVHFHVYNISNQVFIDIEKKKNRFLELNISCSTESFDDSKDCNVHYASRRFVFANHMLSKVSGDVLILDADSLVRNPWSMINASVSKDADIIITKDEASPFWEDICAGFVYLRNTSKSKSFIKKVACFIWNNIEQGNTNWFLDQVALSAVFDKDKNSIHAHRIELSLLFDINHRENSFMWTITSVKDGKTRFHDYKVFLNNKYAI
ncbi:putative nucleotide-diphospho-sugar transferase [Dickeya lacustris]|uniref:Nucleotide-diphospho-sugar transferase n=1 Tax=Dickeya lacustris TaxID=2259638 RepID=A0ABY8G6I2_9GAMM|nr:putative nucleotide-diphospho-sugar transferase [Dickeya lacustris]WFN55571.1 putative nucleotide-diphospho-sugar transferase [Dickeya lacustris]